MTRTEIIKLAQDAGFYCYNGCVEGIDADLGRFAELVAAAAQKALLAACKRYDAWADKTICLDPELAEIRVQMRAAIAAAEGEK